MRVHWPRAGAAANLLRAPSAPAKDLTLAPQTPVRHRQHITEQYVPLTILLDDIDPAIIKGQDSNLVVKIQRGSPGCQVRQMAHDLVLWPLPSILLP